MVDVETAAGERRSGMSRTASTALMAVRWWFGVTYLLSGVGSVVAAFVWMATGNWGGLDLLGGSMVMLVVGWLIHPWGYQRHRDQGLVSSDLAAHPQEQI